MKGRTRFSLLLCCCLAASSLLAQPRAKDSDAWTPRREIATTYEALSLLPRDARADMMRALSPETRAALWQTHVRTYMVEHKSLTDAQRALLVQIVDTISPELFLPAATMSAAQVDAQSAARDAVRGLVTQLRDIMPAGEVRDVAYRIGRDPLPGVGRTLPPVETNVVCDCGDSLNDCGGAACQGICTRTIDGCGPMGMDVCRGLCQ